MCKFKSGIILKNRIILAPEGNESHSNLLKSLNIEDSRFNASKKFVRAELIPYNDNICSDIEKWKFVVDQDIVPEWFENDHKRYEQEFRDAIKDYLKDKFVMICGHPWTPIKEENGNTYYLYYGVYKNLKFSDTNNNYKESKARKELLNSDLFEFLKKEFGSRLVPLTIDLLSLDGLDDYGKVEGDLLAIPTLDLYRECRKKIPNINKSFWLSTPNSTPSGYGSDYVRYVYSDGYVDFDWCGCSCGLRPFFVLKSQIFES